MGICDYDYDEDRMKIKVHCAGCLYGSSIEDFPACMLTTIDKLLEQKKVDSVVLSRHREYEYSSDQVQKLREIASTLEWVMQARLLVSPALLQAERWHPKARQRLSYIALTLLRFDPVAAYVELQREISHISLLAKNPASTSLKAYLDTVLLPLQSRLEATQLVQSARPHLKRWKFGDRSIYRDAFLPIIRPNFMLTRYLVTPPEGGVSVDRYKVGDTHVEIFRLPNLAQNFYFALPPEFRFSEEKYAVLDAARRYMVTHKPKTAEFVKTEKIREVFTNIGRDLIRDTAERMHVYLSTKDLEEMAQILTRYTAGMGVLEILLADDRIQDVYVNSPIEKQPIMVFHAEQEECTTNLIPTREDAESWATRLRILSGRPLDEANPVLDTDLGIPGGKARFAVITKSLSPLGLGFAIRRHRDKPWTLPLFIKAKYLPPLAAGLLSFLVDGAVSLLIAGGRGSGKSSLLASLMLEILPKTRIVVLEDTLELPVQQMIDLHYNIESMKTRSVITRVETEMPADEALRASLRLGDSSLIVGEIRSVEAKALWEAMRIGALSNLVAGTIHGESAYGVFDRVVNDLGVPKTSFKATDIVTISKMLKSADGLHRFRRVTEITEIRKEWDSDPQKEGGFVNLMEYSGKDDTLKPTDTLLNGESQVLNRIASLVREWSGDWNVVWENIQLRAQIKEAILNAAEKLQRPELLEADWTVRSNARFHTLSEQVRQEVGSAESKQVFEKWLEWYKQELKSSQFYREAASV